MKFNILHGLQQCGLPIVVTFSSPHLCFLVDTGSSHNVIFSYVLESSTLKYSTLEETQQLMGVTGEQQETLQVQLDLSFGNNLTRAIFSILDASIAISKIKEESGIQIHGILGIPFMIQNEWILDFKHNIIETK